MTIAKQPFVRYRLEEEPKIRDIISVSLNKEERAWLNELKRTLNLNNDSKTLKIGAFIGKNVIQQMFSPPIQRVLFKKKP